MKRIIKNIVWPIVQIIVTVACLWSLTSCASTHDVPKNTIASAAEVATDYLLKTQFSDEERKEVAAQAYAIAVGVRSLSVGDGPTNEEVRQAILAFGGNPRWSKLASALSGVYADFYDKNVNEDAKVALEILEAIALGVERGAALIEEGAQ